MKKDKFFTFNQNNSGGSFTGPACYVIIEARDPDDANRLAERAGLYFNGCDAGIDCSCCGDRWWPIYHTDKGDDKPSIYGDPVAKSIDSYGLRSSTNGIICGEPDIPYARVFYANGKTEDYRARRQHENRPKKKPR